ncbi:MAG TPA: response regulator [Blastocatellia bacterium]|nr:response regulator [Blastocatellia bacterium]
MAEQRLRILLVDDDQDDYVITRELVDEIGNGEWELEWVSTYTAAVKAIERSEHDVYLVDYQLGKSNGLQLLREAGGAKPILVLTGVDSAALDSEAIGAGAAGYLVKGQTSASTLRTAILGALDPVPKREPGSKPRSEPGV